jgi:inner membrane transporter RhtA
MVLAGMFSVQSGAALATGLFGEIGPVGALFLRAFFGSAALLLVTRQGAFQAFRSGLRGEVALFGLTLAALNLGYFLAIERLPLGVVVTLEFLGPLGVAVFGQRSRRDLWWVGLATIGVVVLSAGASGEGGSLIGVAFALGAAVLWACYIIQSARVGAGSPGLGALTMAMLISALLLAPFGIVEGGSELLRPTVLLVGLAVGILGSAIPFSFELEALRRIPSALFAILMSLEPAVAALVGFVGLSQDLSVTELLAIALVVVASIGALTSPQVPAPKDG